MMNARALHRMCLSKPRHKTREAAQRKADQQAAKWKVPHRVYACPVCAGWHLTTRKESA